MSSFNSNLFDSTRPLGRRATAVIARPASAAAGATIHEDQITRNGCVVTIPFTVETSGTYTFIVGDDGTNIFEKDYTASAGETVQAVWTITSNIDHHDRGER